MEPRRGAKGRSDAVEARYETVDSVGADEAKQALQIAIAVLAWARAVVKA